MTSRLSIIRECLTLTGNNLYTDIDDGTPEWNVGSAAFDAGARWLYGEHDWNFGTEFKELAANVDAADAVIAPDDPNYTYRFTRPLEALHIVKVMDEGGSTLKDASDYRIAGNRIYAQVDTIILEFVAEPDPEDWDPLFTKAITHATMAGIYRGLDKNVELAQKEDAFADKMVQRARPRTDLQEPGKARFNSTLATSRSRRRG